ncbi:hypothetical protein SNE35_31560 [Paucibacter sp. R3-3]|uniref:Uncharacterized protein n=1 Tax=Roseateles agri TaxID=3098619 RepID=A0ABU5DRY2_9BURK|nr:hypothetical protein [Paucibacter sp. R3-3]MDY0749077.1 hypothetical protein [Paucibacter sp. R3-3]
MNKTSIVFAVALLSAGIMIGCTALAADRGAKTGPQMQVRPVQAQESGEMAVLNSEAPQAFQRFAASRAGHKTEAMGE